MAKTKMKSDEQIVRTVNSCLNLHLLTRLLTEREWNRFIDLVDSESGQLTNGAKLIFSGDPTGFHIEDNDGVTDCASLQTTLLTAFFPKKAMRDLQKKEVL